jgi:(p)ppGpp synthase/HD superfamily hydrolase
VKFSNPIAAAKTFAALVHDEKRYGAEPYSRHLQDVVDVLLKFEVTTKDILAAGYLHDVLEDTEVTKDTLLNLFGSRVTELVFAVTDGEGKNRAERKAAMYPKVRYMGPDALMVKLADRIANVSHAIAANNIPMFMMYGKEQPHFAKELRSFGMMDRWWAKLDSLFIEGEKLLTAPPAPVIREM